MGDFLKPHFPPQLCLYNPHQSSIVKKDLEAQKGREIGRRRRKERKWYSFLDSSSKCELILDFFNQTKLFFNHSIHFHLCSWATRIEYWVLEFIHPNMRGMWAWCVDDNSWYLILNTWFLLLFSYHLHNPLFNLISILFSLHLHNLFLSHFLFSFLLISSTKG